MAGIVAAVRKGGDKALLKFARSLDRLDGAIVVSRGDLERAAESVPASIRY